MTVKKPKNPEKILIEGEPVIHTETALMPYRMPRPRAPRPVLPPSFFNSIYFDNLFKRCDDCATQYFNLEPWDLTLAFYDKAFCSCSLKRLVNRVRGVPEETGLKSLMDCPHRFS